jgi:two-component system nitrogen regulation response regulator NtrX
VSSVRPEDVRDVGSIESPLTDSLDEYEKALILRALAAANGNIAEAARRLRTDRPNLYRRMKRLGIAGDTVGVS